MIEQAENPILAILKKSQADAASFRAETNERLEGLMRKQRRDMAGILGAGKATAGTFAEDIAAVTKRMDALEALQH